MDNMSENLFQAIDILTSKRVGGLKFDKTLLCKIIDDTKSIRGEYRVTDGSSTFTAYSDVTTYRNGASVYVVIPEGDFSKRKIITGKHIEDGGEYYTYISPFRNYLDITGNFIKNENSKFGLIANGKDTTLSIFTWEKDSKNSEPIFPKYTRMGIKGNFKTLLHSLNPVTGHYGLGVRITGATAKDVTSNKKTVEENYYFLDSDEFYGNIYNFETYYPQEMVIDISNLLEIQKIELLLYQKNDFYDITKAKIVAASYNNIFVESPYLSFGFSADDFVKDSLFLYTLDGETYDVGAANVLEKIENDTEIVVNRNKKTLHAKWVCFVDQNEAKIINNQEDMRKWGINATLHWYRYVQRTKLNDPLAGNFWEELTSEKDKFTIEIIPDHTLQRERFKAILEYPNGAQVEANWMQRVVDNWNPEEYGWYKITGSEEDFQIFLDEDKGKGSKRIELENKIAEIDNAKKEELASPFKEQKLTRLEQEKELLKNEILSCVEDIGRIYEECKREYRLYESQELVFTNETLVPSNPNVDLIDGLNIIVDRDGLGGNYMIYGMTNELLKATEASRSRTLEAVYKSLTTDDETLNKAEMIIWKIPATGTMIAEPVLGIDYVTQSYYDKLSPDEKSTVNYNKYDFIKMTMPNPSGGPDVKLVDEETGMLVSYDGYYWLIREGTEYYYQETESGAEPLDKDRQISVYQTYKIKNYYQQNAKNNTVYCSIRKNGFTYTAEATMNFGPHGSNGTDNTLLLQMRRYRKEGDTIIPLELVSSVHPGAKDIMIEARLFDYNNTEVQIDGNKIKWKKYSPTLLNNSGLFNIVFNGNNGSYSYQKQQQVSVYNSTLGTFTNEEQTINIYCVFLDVGTYNSEKDNREEFWYNIVQCDVDYGDCTIGAHNAFGVDFENVDENGVASLLSNTKEQVKAKLTTFLSIPFTTVNNLNWAEIPSQIIYDSTGTNPTYYKDSIRVGNKNGKYAEIIECDIRYIEKTTANNRSDRAYYPSIKKTEEKNGKINYSLAPLNMFFNGLNKEVAIYCKYKDGDTIGEWYQPLLIIQNRWPSAVLNSWDGSLTIDEKNGIILSTMMGAGKKESDNSFTGVLMGDVKQGAGINATRTGVYGYHFGSQSFGFRDDGTAFLGKAGKGQILFDGNSGKIQSMSYGTQGTGMMIDLDDGIIDIHGSKFISGNNDTYTKKIYESTGSQIRLDVAPGQDKPYFLIKGDQEDYKKVADTTRNNNEDTNDKKTLGKDEILMYVGANKYYLKTLDFVDADDDSTGMNGQGMKIDLGSGKIVGYDFSLAGYDSSSKCKGSYFNLNSNGKPYFKVFYNNTSCPYYAARGNEGISLIEITKTKFCLQSQDFYNGGEKVVQYNENGNPVQKTVFNSGLKIDLDDGLIEGYNFTLTGMNSEGRYKDSYFKIGSNGNPYLRVHHKDSDENATQPQKNGMDLLLISKDKFFLQSKNYIEEFRPEDDDVKTKSGGIKIDLNNGSIKGYDFNLYGLNTENNSLKGSYFKLSSTGSTANPFIQIFYKNNTGNENNENHQPNGINLFYIDKNNFYLQSHNWNPAKSTGLKLDMTEGKMTGYDFELVSKGSNNSSYVRFSNTNPYLKINDGDGKTLMYVGNDSYYIQSSDFDSSERKGMKINLKNGSIEAYDFTLKTAGSDTESEMIISTAGSPFFKINDEGGNTLINISNGTYYLQSGDFASGSKGVKFDLATGKLTGYSFEIKGVKKVGEEERFIEINSGATTYPLNIFNKFKVAWNGDTEIGGSVTIAGDLELNGTLTVKSGKIIAGNSDDGYYYNLTGTGGTLAGWTINKTSISKDDIILYTGTSSEKGYIRTGSTSGNYCKMDDNGTFFANHGTIGGWTISGSSLEKGNIRLDATSSGGYIRAGSTNGNYCIMDDNGTFFANFGTIGGWTISGSSLKKGNITLNASDGYIKAGGNETYCKMNNNGTFFANSGTIGGWTISSNSLTVNGSGSTGVWLYNDGQAGFVTESGHGVIVKKDGVSVGSKYSTTIGGSSIIFSIGGTSYNLKTDIIDKLGDFDTGSSVEKTLYLKDPYLLSDQYWRVKIKDGIITSCTTTTFNEE